MCPFQGQGFVYGFYSRDAFDAIVCVPFSDRNLDMHFTVGMLSTLLHVSLSGTGICIWDLQSGCSRRYCMCPFQGQGFVYGFYRRDAPDAIVCVPFSDRDLYMGFTVGMLPTLLNLSLSGTSGILSPRCSDIQHPDKILCPPVAEALSPEGTNAIASGEARRRPLKRYSVPVRDTFSQVPTYCSSKWKPIFSKPAQLIFGQFFPVMSPT
jgi:hypothetical protein